MQLQEVCVRIKSRWSMLARVSSLLVLLAMVSAVLAVPARTAQAASGRLTMGQFDMVILNPPSGGEVAISLDDVYLGAHFVRFRVDWWARDTRVQQIRMSGVPGGPILGFDLDSSIFQPQPRDSNQIILNVNPPERSFHNTFMVELAGGLGASVISEIALVDLTTNETVAVQNVQIKFNPAATSDTINLSGSTSQYDMITLVSGGQLSGSAGASVTGAVNSLPGSSIAVTQGQFTLGDGSAPVTLSGDVAVAPGSTLALNSSTPAELGGKTEVTHGTVSATPSMVIGTSSTAQSAIDLETTLMQVQTERIKLLEAEIQQQVAVIQGIQAQKQQLQQGGVTPEEQVLLDQLSAQEQLELLRLQSLSNKRSDAYDAISGYISKNAAVNDKIIANIRSTLIGDVDVVGTLQIGGPRELGHTDVAGDLTLYSGSQLAIESIGTASNQTDNLTVNGDVTFKLGAILKFDLRDPADMVDGGNPYDPQLFDQFDILTADHITSDGIYLDLPSLTDRTFIVGIYDNSDGSQTLRLTVVPYSEAPLDTTAPAASPAPEQPANANGWNNTDVTLHWNWSDDGAGIDATQCTTTTTSAGEGALTLSATCSDLAGNQGNASYTLKVDKTAPSLSPIVMPNSVAVGGSATVSPNAGDSGSGIASASCGALDLSSPGAKTVACSATDLAGNTATASANYTVLANSATPVLVRHAPVLNSGARIEGSLQLLSGEATTLNGSATITGDLLVPGSPTVVRNGSATIGATTSGTGNAQPSGYRITLNSGATVNRLVTRTDPVALPVVPAPPTPSGVRNVVINQASQSIGDPATMRNLTLNSNAGAVAVPPGTYGQWTANGSARFVLGVAGASTPAVYNLQGLTLNSNAGIDLVGPVVLNLANGLTLNSTTGISGQTAWLTVNIAAGAVTLNGSSSFYGTLRAPSSTVTLNSNTRLVGGLVADRLTLNGTALVQLQAAGRE